MPPMTDPMPRRSMNPQVSDPAPPTEATAAPGTSGAPGPIEGDSLRDRCARLGIDWLEETPETSPDAVTLINAEAAIRLRVVPLRLDEDRLKPVIRATEPSSMARRKS